MKLRRVIALLAGTATLGLGLGAAPASAEDTGYYPWFRSFGCANGSISAEAAIEERGDNAPDKLYFVIKFLKQKRNESKWQTEESRTHRSATFSDGPENHWFPLPYGEGYVLETFSTASGYSYRVKIVWQWREPGTGRQGYSSYIGPTCGPF
jgi:hypothetical protein